MALLNEQKTSGDPDKEVKLPSFSYLIDHMVMFDFHKSLMLLVSYENGDCQLFDLESGIFQYQFEFRHKIETKKKVIDEDEKEKPTKSAAEVIEKMHTFLQEKQPKNTKWQEFGTELRKEVENY